MSAFELLELFEPEKRLENIDVSLIIPNPDQPRATFDDESIAELATSIKEVGLIQPLTVRYTRLGKYELIAGERRLRAIKKLGIKEVECIVLSNIENEQSATMALVENLQRENLHFLEEAQCYEKLLKTYCMTQDELAKKIGKSQSSIANKLRLLRMSDDIKAAMTDAGLSERHARALLRLNSDANRLAVIKKINEKNLSVKETERLVDKTLNTLFSKDTAQNKPKPLFIRLIKDYRLFTNTINTAICQLRESGMKVEVEQTDRMNGVDISIRVTRN
ncbi:MAG: ParB/RepB/Spo0J family partition protein [Clostridia bacterium]|nr:ParB/RepB/Spo0J family partition protein [Clostridia bacterium]